MGETVPVGTPLPAGDKPGRKMLGADAVEGMAGSSGLAEGVGGRREEGACPGQLLPSPPPAWPARLPKLTDKLG